MLEDDLGLGSQALTRNALLTVDGEPHRVLALLPDHVLLSHLATGRPFLVQDAAGLIGLPCVETLRELAGTGRLRALSAMADDEHRSDADRLEFEIALLDGAGVRNGTKAIWLFLNRTWTSELLARFGEPDNPATLKRIRTARNRARRA